MAILEPLMLRLKCPSPHQKLGRSLWRALPWWSLFPSSLLVCSQQDGARYYAINWGWARLGWHLLFLKQHCHHPPLLSHHWQGRGLAPVSAASRKPGRAHWHVGTLEEHVRKVAPLKRWKPSNSATPCIIICLSVIQYICGCCLDHIRKEGIPIYLSWRQAGIGQSCHWRPRWHRDQPSNRLWQPGSRGGVPTLFLTYLWPLRLDGYCCIIVGLDPI